jgi:hypothetical protein
VIVFDVGDAVQSRAAGDAGRRAVAKFQRG